MPKGPKVEKRHADVIGNVIKITRIATGEKNDELTDDGRIRPLSVSGSVEVKLVLHLFQKPDEVRSRKMRRRSGGKRTRSAFHAGRQTPFEHAFRTQPDCLKFERFQATDPDAYEVL